jgi:hypothetical protein
MNKYTSFEFSKLLADNGCSLESDEYICTTKPIEFKEKNQLNEFFNGYPKYDILWDICVKYAKEFFGDENLKTGKICACIFTFIKMNIPQEEIEKYIWDNCLFKIQRIKEKLNDTNF